MLYYFHISTIHFILYFKLYVSKLQGILVKIANLEYTNLTRRNINIFVIYVIHLPTTIPNAPNVKDFGLLQNSGG